MAGLVYLFTSGTSWTVPAGVTSVQVECYGPGASIIGTTTKITSLNSGGSYSKSNTISVTPGSTVYLNIGSSGGNTWFNTSNVAPTSSSSTSSACLAVGSSTASGSQIAANCGDVKYKGGNGYNSPAPSGGWSATGQGGQAGPNGNGADAGPAYYVASNGKLGSGGGANGGSQAAYNTIPYGRGGSGSSQGRGAYVTAIYGTDEINTYVAPTQDIVGTANFSNGTGSYLSAGYDYGPYGGTYGNGYQQSCTGCTYVGYYGLNNYQSGFIVITLVTQTIKYLLVNAATSTNSYQTGSFTLPSDFGSLTSIEAFGAGGRNADSIAGGGGGGGYSKTLGSSVTTSMVAGSTVVYYQVGSYATATDTGGDCPVPIAGPVYPSWINIGTNSAPTSVTSGVLANGGQGYFGATGATGATTTGAVGDTKYGGGNGGSYTTGFATGGGGGGGGPLGAGANGGNGSSVGTGYNGGGGGGASNGGNAGSIGTLTAGGAGGTITGGTGGTGATSTTNASAGTNGGGGGGGFTTISGVKAGGGGGVYPIAANVYGVVGGSGGNGYTPAGGGYNYANTAYPATGLIVFAYTTGAAPTVVALTGSSSTASAGTLTPVPSFTQALSGRSATASAGTLTPVPSFTQALSGASASASTGIFGTSNAQIVNLSSTSITAYSGTLTNSQIAVQALTGVSASGQTSSFPANSDLVGVVASAGTGALNYINTGWQPIDTGGTAIWTDIDTQQI
jgi:hypothetical protein